MKLHSLLLFAAILACVVDALSLQTEHRLSPGLVQESASHVTNRKPVYKVTHKKKYAKGEYHVYSVKLTKKYHVGDKEYGHWESGYWVRYSFWDRNPVLYGIGTFFVVIGLIVCACCAAGK